ncbi:MAG: type I pullulanase, partial [Bacteroidaceae bacterium]|nr:type I pullulanase [Bacteroidaceae bacterium]
MNSSKSILIMSIMASSLTIDAQLLRECPIPVGPISEMAYTPTSTHFSVWAPTAQAARVNLYDADLGNHQVGQYDLVRKEDGTWQVALSGNYGGRFYTFQIQVNGQWKEETPGIFAKAVGRNGQRAQVIDMQTTNPEGWEQDKRPLL